VPKLIIAGAQVRADLRKFRDFIGTGGKLPTQGDEVIGPPGPGNF
jgi:hypothetical protein